MRRGWFIVLALSLGLNVGLLVTVISGAGRMLGWHLRRHFVGELHRPPADIRGHWVPQHWDDPVKLMHHRMQHLGDHLDLEEHQHDQMVNILEEMLPQILTQQDEVVRARVALRDECLSQQSDPARVREVVGRMNAAQAKLDSLVTETMLCEGEVLTPEQRSRYFLAMPWHRWGERGHGAGQGRSRHGGQGPGPQGPGRGRGQGM
jgi:Spy/CpxP family protein refolding chaperone